MKRLLTVIGTRPNIIKITQFRRVVKNYPALDLKFVHTGQHYNQNMSDVFFSELDLQSPEYILSLDKTTVVSQLAQIMEGLEKVVTEYKPDVMIVVGDVNSTLAAALVANKMNIHLVHVESGLRSFDKTMPEEHNRVITDSITNTFFVTEESGKQNLIKEGKDSKNIHMVGNTMIDTLVAYDKKINEAEILKTLGLKSGSYALMTMHRPGNVDSKEGLLKLIEVIRELTTDQTVVFPIHPRTVNRLKEFNLLQEVEKNKNLKLMEPAGYLDFQKLILECQFVITDSGGIQEETTFRQIPCLTLRPNTERPCTVDIGSNLLLNFNKAKVMEEVAKIKKGNYKKCAIPPLWDGKSTERIFETLSKF
ncbi:MAG: UDP-N-acetylglucosamine 2-epimerase (non-hydrolyzing) [Cytophagaceae bacterium]|nr:UDP-N-acetylglucosamine 2-epimerase (non-hydrolyzing) [Cytophagaceae bacterium]